MELTGSAIRQLPDCEGSSERVWKRASFNSQNRFPLRLRLSIACEQNFPLIHHKRLTIHQKRRCWFAFARRLFAAKRARHHKPVTMHEFNRCTGGQSLLAMASGGAQFGGAEKEVDDAAKQKPWFVRRFRPAQLKRGELERRVKPEG